MFRSLMIALVVAVTSVPAGAQAHEGKHPIVFVHGFSGSGSQFETQARRFAGSGYPAEIIEAHEYDSTFTVNTVEQIYAGLDARIARLLAQTGAGRVDLLGHSLGTSLMQGYLNSSPERAGRVAHYVNLDGATAAAPPGGVPTLAIWGEGNPARAIAGATNVYLSDQAHTQTVSSAESFTEVYRFFTGRNPRTTRIVPEPPGHVRLSGRAVLFPLNVGVPEATLEIWEV
jgi:pimeloyl-ACP methyl ester carboxylesterase